MIVNFVVLAAVLLCILPSRAAAQCPADFLDAGELSAAAAAGKFQEVSVTKDLLLPKGIRIDGSYHQTVIHAAGDGAASDMRAAEIPAGIHLIPAGRTAGGWWSISKPKLKLVDAQWRFKIDLYANSGTRAVPADSDVRVRVCVLPSVPQADSLRSRGRRFRRRAPVSLSAVLK